MRTVAFMGFPPNTLYLLSGTNLGNSALTCKYVLELP
jgi:hypothetical protein